MIKQVCFPFHIVHIIKFRSQSFKNKLELSSCTLNSTHPRTMCFLRTLLLLLLCLLIRPSPPLVVAASPVGPQITPSEGIANSSINASICLTGNQTSFAKNTNSFPAANCTDDNAEVTNETPRAELFGYNIGDEAVNGMVKERIIWVIDGCERLSWDRGLAVGVILAVLSSQLL